MVGLLSVLLLVPRPVLSGAELIVDANAAYRVHYTLAGIDAPPHGATDLAPQNGVPDDIDAVEAGLVTVYDHWVAREGMRAPLSDGAIGGDGRIDVYVRGLGGPRGNVYPEPAAGSSGGSSAASAWIEVEPRTALDSPLRLSAAAGHEAHHAIEYAYDATLARFIYEASAAFVEHADFQSAALQSETDAHYAALLREPQKPLDLVDGAHEYDEMALIAWLAASESRTLPQLWQTLASVPDVPTALSRLLGGRPVDALLAAYALWLPSACRPASEPPDDGRCVVASAPRWIGVAGVPSVLDVDLPPLSMAYVRIPAAGDCLVTRVAFTGSDAVAWGVAATTRAPAQLPGEGAVLDFGGGSLVFARGASPSGTLRLSLSATATAGDGGLRDGVDLGRCGPDGGWDAPTKSGGCGCRLSGGGPGDALRPPSVPWLLALGSWSLWRGARRRRRCLRTRV